MATPQPAGGPSGCTAELVVTLSVIAGLAVGALLGLLAGDARIYGAVGALTGLVVGLVVVVLSPLRTRKPTAPGHHHRGRRTDDGG